ncbi:hypothetical protein LTR28_005575 [Elasticomyces elasticus]|nr:hypothetical protein LTR28_005575 [Elasticomyces elasticus]
MQSPNLAALLIPIFSSIILFCLLFYISSCGCMRPRSSAAERAREWDRGRDERMQRKYGYDPRTLEGRIRRGDIETGWRNYERGGRGEKREWRHVRRYEGRSRICDMERVQIKVFTL